MGKITFKLIQLMTRMSYATLQKTNEIEELKTFEYFANESKLSAHKVEIRAGCRLLRFSADNLWNLFKF